MFLIIGIILGLNLAIRVVLSEAREYQIKGRVSFRGRTRLTFRDIASIAARGALFLLLAAAIGLALDLALDTTLLELFAEQDAG